MKKNYSSLRNLLGSLVLGTMLLLNSGESVYAGTIDYRESSDSRELPKPYIQNAHGTFFVELTNYAIPTEGFVNKLNEYFGLDTNHHFEQIREVRDAKTGFVHYSYQHFYKQLKVEGNVVFVHTKDEKVNSINGQLLNQKNLDITPAINDLQATEATLKTVEGEGKRAAGAIELLIAKITKGEQVDLKLVKKLNVLIASPVKSLDVYVDAKTGEVVRSFSKIYHADTPSTSTTYNRGNQSITVDSYNGGYRLKDNARNIHTRNASGWDGDWNMSGEFTGNITEFTNTTANFTATNMRPAVEVHWGMTKTYDYYFDVHNRDSYDGNGSLIRNYYDPPANHFPGANAAALDDYGTVAMVYGNGIEDMGSGPEQVMHPLVLLDIAGHEFSHLVIGRNGTGGLDYEGESGALNESFADIFGKAIEFYVNDNPSWMIGNGIWNLTWVTPNYMRNMADPNSAPTAVGYEQPDTYEGNYWLDPTSWYDNGGVHINSGVGNYWFYLLSEGGSGTNDLNNSYYVDGISIQKAEQIAYKTLMTGLTQTATYLDAFNATKLAAAALYGANSNEWNQVVNAWYAVGIGNAPASNQNVEMKTKLNIYPNPAKGNEVTIDAQLEGKVTVEMYDMTGKLLIAPVVLNTSTTVLNIEHYEAGLYILKFESDSGSYSHKLIIQ
ncbi:MAG TPA: M4 family metallopeptidase [Flavobacterium sp.]|nr:M4 family metallopeptidase [Flavobacterium sp.]